MIATTLENGPEGQLEEWGDIHWRRVRKIVRNLPGRRFRARKLGNYRTLVRLQKLMKRSRANLLLSIRQITQVNTGKFTAGVDKCDSKVAVGRQGRLLRNSGRKSHEE